MIPIPDIYLWADDKGGLGHVMRCRALEEEWLSRGGTVHFTGTPDRPSIIVFDGYNWENRALALWGRDNLIVRIEDRDLSGAEEVPCDIFINNSYGRTEEHLPPLPVGCTVLLGLRYYMLRNVILNARVENSGMGMFDADAQNRAMEPGKFAQALASAEIVLCSAGLTSHEALFFGKPIMLRCVADNQKINYHAMIRDGIAVPCDSGIPPTNNRGQTYIDDGGRVRVADAILEKWVEAVSGD